ncbi:helix-turn-helix domain-containing protein [bacterium]|nr:helix-turn-helix domain-containing protein [bacterium]
MNETITKRIRKAREERDLTQQDVADYLGRTAASISDLERGKVQVSAKDLFKLSQFLNKPIEYFYGEEYLGDDVQDLISIIRRMPPEIRASQVSAIKTFLELQHQSDVLMQIEDQDEDLQKEHAKDLYNILSNYLILITEMRNKALEAKNQLEEILDISSQ